MIFNMVGGGGGSAGGGATLVVSSPANVSVTVSKDDKSYTKNSGSLGSTTFKGLATGTWTVTISGNGQTATKTIEITADYAITIAFFSAFINITYPATSTCVVTNSSGQTVASDTNAGSSAKTWTATVNATGTYTVTATATDGSGKSKSQSVSITADGQSVSVSLSYTLYLFREGDGINNDLILKGFYPRFAITNNDLPFNLDFGVISSEYMKATNESTGNTYWVSELIDVSAYNTLYVDLICGNRYDSGKVVTIGVGPDAPSESNQFGTWAASTSNIYNTTRETVSVDLGDITGKMYVKIGAWGIIHSIYNWWLE